MTDILKSNDNDGRSNYMLQWLDAHDSGPIANDAPHLDTEDEQGFVGHLYGFCFRELQDFHRRQRDIPKSRSIVLRECLGRLYLWGEPFGSGDLDKALGQSDELRYGVLERLVYIGKVLLRRSILSTPSPKAPHQPSKQIIELESIIEQGKLLISGKQDEVHQNGDEEGEDHNSESDDSSESGSYDTIEDISFATTCLMELGPSLEQNLQHTKNARKQSSHLSSVPFAVSASAMIYVKLIGEKFEQAHHKLVERLGEANWQRHRDVRDKIWKTELLPQEIPQEKTTFRPYSDFHDSGIGTSVPAQTEYAPSHTSFLSSNPEGQQVSLRVPKEPPEVGAGEPFQCFLCRCVISNVRNRIAWKMHVFADLRPYICTFPDCKDELAQFTTRAAWADHEWTEHRYDMMWSCPECSVEFAGTSDWEQHLHDMHQRIFTGPQLRWARKTAYRIHPRTAETEECPLCRVVPGKPRRKFVKHVARHMEEIALMALPSSIGEDSDGSSDGTDRISLASENQGPQATNIVDLPPDIRENWAEGSENSISTIKDSINAEDSELQPVENTAEAGGDEKLQPVESAAEAGGHRKLQPVDNAAKEGGEGKLQRVESTVQTTEERKLQPVESAADASEKGKLLPPPRPFKNRYWICGNCRAGGMSIAFDSHCIECSRPKDVYATEYC